AQFLIVALWRLRMAAEAAEELVSEPRVVRAAIVEFDRAFPRLESLRHVLMHFDNYVSESDDRRNTDASGSRLLARHDVWAMHVSPDGISWLGASYNYDPTEQAALALYRVVSERLLEVAGE